MYLARRRTWMLTGALALIGLLSSAAAPAQRAVGERASAEGLYAAEVPVRSQDENERRTGFARALALVLGKLSGDLDSSKRPGVNQELRRAEHYVERFDYRQDEEARASGARTFSTMLVVHFRPADVDAIVATLGLPIWPEPRPKPVLWLAIDDGRGIPRLAGLPQSNAVRPLLDRAIARGYRLGLPAGDAAEQMAVDAIWKGETATIATLSSRYNPPIQLIGKLYRSGDGWTAEWILLDNGHRLARATRKERDARLAMATGADVAADALAKRDARVATQAQPSVQRVAFTGIHDSADYVRLSAALQQMAVVRGFRPAFATPGRLEVELDLVSGLDGFRKMLDGDVLMAVEAGGVPVFQLRARP